MAPAGPERSAPPPVPWDEAREVVALVLAACAAAMALAPVAFRFLDGQIDAEGFRSALEASTAPVTGLVILVAALVVVTTPVVDVPPRLRRLVVATAVLVAVFGALHSLDILFSASAGGRRRFFTRFPTILWRPGPSALMGGLAAWLASRVAVFPAPRDQR